MGTHVKLFKNSLSPVGGVSQIQVLPQETTGLWNADTQRMVTVGFRTTLAGTISFQPRDNTAYVTLPLQADDEISCDVLNMNFYGATCGTITMFGYGIVDD